MKKHSFFILFTLSISSYALKAQPQQMADSLIKVFESGVADSIRLKACDDLTSALVQYDSATAEYYIAKGMELAKRLGDDETRLYLKSDRGTIQYYLWHYDKAIPLYKEVIAESKKKGLEELTAYCLYWLGNVYFFQYKYDEAIATFHKSLEKYQELDNKVWEAAIILNIGQSFQFNKKFTKALVYVEKALKIYETLGNKANIAKCLGQMGGLNKDMGNTETAISFLEQSIEMGKEAGNMSRVAINSSFLALLYNSIGRSTKALFYYSQVLDIYEKLNWQDNIANTLKNIGDTHYQNHDYTTALLYYKRCFKRIKKIEDKSKIADLLNRIGLVCISQGNYESGLQYFEKSLKIDEELNDKDKIISVLHNIGSVYEDLGDYNCAMSFFKQSLALERKTPRNDSQLAICNFKVGMIYLKQAKEDSASHYIEQGMAMGKQKSNLNDVRFYIESVGRWYNQQGKFAKALELYQNTFEMALTLKDTISMADIHTYMAELYCVNGEFFQAVSYLQQAKKAYIQIGLKSGVSKIKLSMAKIYGELGEYEKAFQSASTAYSDFQQLGDSCNLGSCLLVIGNAYLFLKQVDSAVIALNNSVRLSLQCNDNAVLGLSYMYLGQAHQFQTQENQALRAYEIALSYAVNSQNREIQKKVAELLYPIYEKKGQLQKAYKIFKIFHASNDSLFNKKNTSALVQREMEYKYDKELQSKALLQQQQATELQQQKWLTYTAIGVCLSLILIGTGFYRNYRNKQKANILLQKQNQEIEKQRTALESLDHTKSRFFANISHELRTPITLISSPLQNLLQHSQETFLPSTKKTLQMVQRNAQSLKGLVNDILDLSKLESDKVKLHEEVVQTHSLLSRIASNFDSIAQHLGIHYTQSFQNLPAEACLADIGKMGKILNNLLSNALKHTPAGGSVELIAQLQGEQLLLQVKDTGNGIPETDLPYIFNRFYQSQQPGIPLQGGTGIGLALAKELSHFMGGELTVESELGTGTTFSVLLPYKVAKSQEALVIEIEEEAEEEVNLTLLELVKATDKRHQVLIVEDHPDMQTFVNSLISPNHHTLLACNGKEALKILEKEKIDLIISDVMMPEMDGYTLLKHLKDSDTYRNIPVIMLTALGDEAHKLQALTIGVDDYLSKPFSPQELLARVNNLLVRNEARQYWQEEEPLTENTKDEFATADKGESESAHVLRSDVEWLEEVEKTIRQELENEDFRLSLLAEQFHLSERQFQRKIKKITGFTPKQYQQEIALQKARKLLENGSYQNTTAIAYSIGMNHVSRFSKLYEARFGKKPSDYFIQKMEVIN
jgi:signal transduction histidine kinase/DNA-binding response OmpR family regulator